MSTTILGFKLRMTNTGCMCISEGGSKNCLQQKN